MNRNSRRKFLKTAGLGLGAFLAKDQMLSLLQDMANWNLVKAQADETGTMPKKYIHIHLNGAPPRWMFDQWLIPFSGSLASGQAGWNVGLANAISSSGVLTHETFNHAYTNYAGVSKTIKLPHHLEGKVAGPGGTLRNISDLFKNMAVIQGYNSNSDGHSVNSPISVFPDPAVPSINGAIADGRKDPIAAVAASSVLFQPFKSAKSKTISTSNIWPAGQSVGGMNDGGLGSLMGVFRPETYNNSLLNSQNAYAAQTATYRAAFSNLAATSDANAASLLEQYQGLEALLPFTSAASLTTEWQRLFTKYATIINQSIELNNDGFRVPKIGFGSNTGDANSVAGYSVTTGSGSSDCDSYAGMPNSYDLREMLTNPGNNSNNRNNSSQAPASNDFMMNSDIASSMALIEFVIVNKISGVISGGSNFNLANIKKHDGTGASLLPNDQHVTGVHSSIVINTAYWRGIISALLELIDVLKTNNMFTDTVIHITSDFGRNPRHFLVGADEICSGSDHGWDGHVTSVISGAFENGPVVVGNIAQEGRGAGGAYRGAWGKGAPVDFNGSSEILSPRHAAAAVAHLAGVTPNPWPFTHLVWKLENGILVPKVDETKWVA